MTARNEPAIRVWDPIVRATHWVVAAIVFWLYFEGSGDESHRLVGYVGAGIVVFRILWGVVGTPHARFSAWWPTPSKITAYLAAARGGSAERHLSHNPLGGTMAIALWILIFALTVTGWMTRLDRFWGEEWLHNLHSWLADALMVCVAVHVLAAVAMSFVHRENLIVSMITGRKRQSSAKGLGGAIDEA